MSGIRPPKDCGLYLPGHCVPWIQARLGWEDQENQAVRGRVVDIRDDGTVLIDVDGERRELWNHQADRLVEALDERGSTVWHQPRWGRLIVGPTAVRYNFCVVAASAERRECPEQPPDGTPWELLRDAGGFSIRASELLAEDRGGR
jgi:hypothetical protein